GQMVEDKMSLLPNAPDQWGGSSMFNDGGKGEQKGEQGGETQEEGREREPRSLASLPEELQKAIRQALQGLQDKGQENQGTTPPPANRWALRPSDEQKQPNLATEAQNLPKGKEQQTSGRGGQGNESKSGSPFGAGGNAQAPDQGSGMQRLDRARLDRKNARGQFQPDSPQVPGSEGGARAGGPGAGSGNGPRRVGNPRDRGRRAHHLP